MATYEIVIRIKNAKDNTIAIRDFTTNNAGELAAWYERNKNVVIQNNGNEITAKKKRRKKKKE